LVFQPRMDTNPHEGLDKQRPTKRGPAFRLYACVFVPIRG
jgi:hypothetical protein